MEEHYKSLSAVFPIIFRTNAAKQQVLLSQRANTGYMDSIIPFNMQSSNVIMMS